MLDAFDRNKYNEEDYVKRIIANSSIIGYGFITAVDFDSVVVTPTVSDKTMSEKVRSTFMNLGSELFSISLKPAIGMRVLILAPNKAAEGMFESYQQLNLNEGRDYILTNTPAIYSSQFTFCIPFMKYNSQAVNSLIIDSELITAEIKHELFADLLGDVTLEMKGDSIIRLQEFTNHEKHCHGNVEETFGMVEGVAGVEKEGDYVYKETYGKFSSVEKNYESGFTATIGKAYEKPFLEDKGELLDASAPVTINLGSQAPLNLSTGAPVTLLFGESAVTVTMDSDNGVNIALTGAAKINISAEGGKFAISNSTGSLKDLIDKVADLFTNLTTIGGNVVPGVPYAAASTPATVALAAELKAFAAGLLE